MQHHLPLLHPFYLYPGLPIPRRLHVTILSCSADRTSAVGWWASVAFICMELVWGDCHKQPLDWHPRLHKPSLLRKRQAWKPPSPPDRLADLHSGAPRAVYALPQTLGGKEGLTRGTLQQVWFLCPQRPSWWPWSRGRGVGGSWWPRASNAGSCPLEWDRPGSWVMAFSLLSPRALPNECQMLLFSATFEDSVWKFAERIIPDPNVIKLRKEELTLNNIQQYYVLCGNRKDKYQALCNIYGGITIGQAIIFCQVTPLGLAFLMPRLRSSWGQGTVRGLRAREPGPVFRTVYSWCHSIFRATLNRDYLYFMGDTEVME